VERDRGRAHRIGAPSMHFSHRQTTRTGRGLRWLPLCPFYEELLGTTTGAELDLGLQYWGICSPKDFALRDLARRAILRPVLAQAYAI